jgi:hypothetical protein
VLEIESDPYSDFLFAMRSPKTKEKVVARLRMFLILLDFQKVPCKTDQRFLQTRLKVINSGYLAAS